MSEKTVVLGLEGDLQSYGTSSKYYIRDTDGYPSKSAVVGIILAAMGTHHPDGDLLEALASMQMRVDGYRSKRSCGVLQDFHMVGSDHEASVWDKQFQLQAEETTLSPTKMTWRRYLMGYKYKVVLTFADDALATMVRRSLTNPEGTLCLGRRTCLPSAPIYRGHEDVSLFSEDYEHAITVHEGERPDLGVVHFVNDVPVALGYHKQYKSRAVTLERVA
jgi:CRISPR system Cascade subunit CasD